MQESLPFVSFFITVTGYSLACLGIGVIILRLIGNINELRISAATKLTTMFLIGQGILANLWVLLASISSFSPSIIKFAVIFFSIIGIIGFYKSFNKIRGQFVSIYADYRNETLDWKIIILLTIIISMAGVTAIGRSPIGDGSAFYLSLAKVISDSHKVTPLPGYEELTSIGLQGEMHFAALMSLGNPDASQIFPLITILSGGILLLALSRLVGLSRRGQWLVLAALFTSSAVTELSGTGKTDLFATAFGFGAYYWAIKIFGKDENLPVWLVGLFSGLALVAKISYLVTFIPSLLLMLVWTQYHKLQYKINSGLIQLSFAFMASFIIAVLPHLIKNYVLFSNPLAPYGEGGDIQNQTWYGLETTRQILLTVPFALTFGKYWAQIGNLSPLVLAFAPLILFLPKPNFFLKSPLVVIATAALMGLACWFLFRPNILAPRYFMACLCLLIIPAAKAAEFCSAKIFDSKMIRNMVIWITGLVIISTGLFYSKYIFIPQQASLLLLGKLSGCKVEQRYCEILTTVNEISGAGERLFSNNQLRYWLRSDLIQCALNSDETNAYLNLNTPEQRWRFIYGRGFQSVLVLNTINPIGNLIHEDLKHIPEWLDVTIIQNDYATYLRLKSLDMSIQPLFGCKQIMPPAWDLFNINNAET